MNGELNILWNNSVDAGPCHGCGNRGMGVEVLCIQAVFETKRVCIRLCKDCTPGVIKAAKEKYEAAEVSRGSRI